MRAQVTCSGVDLATGSRARGPGRAVLQSTVQPAGRCTPCHQRRVTAARATTSGTSSQTSSDVPKTQPAGASVSSSAGRSTRGEAAANPASASGVNVEGYSPTSRQGWSRVKAELRKANVKVVSPQELGFAHERGAVIIDIRPADQYAAGHIPGAVNVPYYQPITGWDPIKVARRMGYALFGVLNGTEVNPNFTVQATQAMKSQQGAILYCSIGGQPDTLESSKKGMQSRSLIAAWQLVTSQCNNISVLKGGYSEWVSGGREVNALDA